MKAVLAKLTAIVMALVALFTGVATSNVKLELKDDVITTETDVISYEMKNYSFITLNTGSAESVFIEKKNGDEWERLPRVCQVREISLTLLPLQSDGEKHTVNIEYLVGHKLEVGEYRLVKPFSAAGEKECTANFTVIEA